mmetsp:Transcript_14232/g.26699  ORF Transcript_14232/g.26699 Transcript_14232/m.26699 type:complete len:173 (-) Transcript_14232:2233-2751(-)
MANAAAKKAAAAQKNATSKFLPILLALNATHAFLIYQRGNLSTYRIFMIILQWILTYVAYQGIIQDIAQNKSTTTTTTLEKYKLAGGAWLDLLFLVLLSQFGSLLFHRHEVFMDLILFLIPLFYGLYHYIVKHWNGSGDGESSNQTQDEDTRKLLEERRRRRSERRRQKRMS